jgi:hypothetical protein
MDFYVVLERPGYRVARRRAKKCRVGVQHKVTKEDSIKWWVMGVVMRGVRIHGHAEMHHGAHVGLGMPLLGKAGCSRYAQREQVCVCADRQQQLQPLAWQVPWQCRWRSGLRSCLVLQKRQQQQQAVLSTVTQASLHGM